MAKSSIGCGLARVCLVLFLSLGLVSAVHRSLQKLKGSLADHVEYPASLLTEDCNTAGTRTGGAVALGGICSFNGNKQYVNLGAVSINGASATFLAWVSFTTFTSWSRVFDCVNVMITNTNTDGGLYLQGQGWTQIANAVSAQTWVLVAGVINAQSGAQTLFVNSGAQSATSSGTFPTVASCNLGYSGWDVDTGLNGYIDRFDIIPTVFAASDVKNVWNVAISSLSYAPSSLQLTKGVAASMVPTVTYASLYGGGTTFSVSPALPTGLSLNPLTGLITGTGQVNSPAAQYTITGRNAGGSATSVISISVAGITSLLTEDCNTAGTRTGGAVALGGICSFNGNKQYVNLGAVSINGASATFLAWVSFTTFTSWSRVFDCVNVMITNTNTDGGLYLQGQGWTQIANAVSAQTWVLVAGVLNAQSGVQTLFVNTGVQSATSSGTFPTVASCNLGYSGWDVDTGLNGYIDRFDIIPSVYAASDVAAVYTIPVQSLSYAPSSSQVALGAAVSIVPTVTYASTYGGGCTYTISPALPAGIVLNPVTGLISGSSPSNNGPTQYTITATNPGGKVSAAITIQVGIAGATTFTWDGTAAAAGALTKLVVYTSAAGVVGLQATFGGYSSAVVGLATATSQTVTFQPAEYLAQITSWFSGNMITGFKFVSSLGKTWGPYGISAGNGDVQAVASQALVKIFGSSVPSGLIYPLKFTWSAGPTGTVPFGTIAAGAYTIASPRVGNGVCTNAADFVIVQTVTFFLYNGPGTSVPNYICGMEISSGGVPSMIVGTFTWPDTTGTITTQSMVVPAGDYLNRWDIIACNIAPGSQQMCGVTITSRNGVVWTIGTTQAQATAANAFGSLVALNYVQNAPSCAFRGFFGNYQAITQNGHSISFVPGALVE